MRTNLDLENLKVDTTISNTKMKELNDPMGQAILDFAQTQINEDITVISDICDDDIIPSEYLFRSYDEMPAIEKTALNHCSGNILDVGAGAGIHATYLRKNGFNVYCIDTSPGAVEHMKTNQLNADQINFFDLKDNSYDTVLMLMNGIGISGNLANLERTLLHAQSILSKNGKIICDSSDIKYLYEDEDGALWMDLNADYYGDFRFQMKYREHTSDWFEWLYVDFDTLKSVAEKIGFKTTQLVAESDHYLAELRM